MNSVLPRTRTFAPVVCREVLFLMAICLVDLISSAVLFHHDLAVEANPVLRWSADAGILPFVSVKLVSFLPALALAEWYRRRRPDLIIPLLRWVGALYLGIYLISVIALALS